MQRFPVTCPRADIMRPVHAGEQFSPGFEAGHARVLEVVLVLVAGSMHVNSWPRESGVCVCVSQARVTKSHKQSLVWSRL